MLSLLKDKTKDSQNRLVLGPSEWKIFWFWVAHHGHVLTSCLEKSYGNYMV